jgi:hypothetical protein
MISCFKELKNVAPLNTWRNVSDSVGKPATQKLETSRKTWRNNAERVIVKGTISVNYTLWDLISLQNVRKNNYKSYLMLKYCRTGTAHPVLQYFNLK